MPDNSRLNYLEVQHNRLEGEVKDLTMTTRQLAEHAIESNGKLDVTNTELRNLIGQVAETRTDLSEMHEGFMSKIDDAKGLVYKALGGIFFIMLASIFADRILSH